MKRDPALAVADPITISIGCYVVRDPVPKVARYAIVSVATRGKNDKILKSEIYQRHSVIVVSMLRLPSL